MTCVITGCEFLDLIHGRFVHGDLYEVGDTWVFNAVTGKHSGTLWQYGTLTGSDKAVISYRSPFDRRGVLVVPKEHCTLSDAAKDYLCIPR